LYEFRPKRNWRPARFERLLLKPSMHSFEQHLCRIKLEQGATIPKMDSAATGSAANLDAGR
jgi:hypothetical protein